MTALQTPAPDAPAEEWGAFAVSIPDWRWPGSCPLSGFFRKAPDASWGRVDNIELFAWGEGECIPDPDHWAWWGWFILLLGPERIQVTMWGDEITVGTDNLVMEPSAFGRACIAAAAALGRWPGGGSDSACPDCGGSIPEHQHHGHHGPEWRCLDGRWPGGDS